MESKKTIRFGIISDSLILKSWEVECLKHVLSLKSTSLELLILPSMEIASNKFGLLRGLTDLRFFSKILFYIYRRLFINPKCYLEKDCSEEFKNIDKVYWLGDRKNISIENFSKEDLKKIKRKELDFIILFSDFTNIDDEILDMPRFGVWAYHHDDEEKYRGNVHCFWEIYHDDSVNGAILKKLTSHKNKYIVIKEGFFKTIKYSYKRNLENTHKLSTRWLTQACIDLINGCDPYLSKLPRESKAKFFFEPNNLQFIKFYIKLLKNKLYRVFKELFLIEQWNVGYINNSIYEIFNDDKYLKINWMFSPSRKESYADPFPIKWNDKLYIFFENFNLDKKKGVISFCDFDADYKNKEMIKDAMKTSFHLSYPFIFSYEDSYYLLPESSETKEIALYRAIRFPFEWQKVAVLLKNIQASDSTIFEYSGLWWLACTIINEGWNQRLYIFYSEDLFGKWLPHAQNPVKTDIRSSRPAGKVFQYDGFLIRPSQDCSKAYGGRILLNKITKLTPFKFEEEVIKTIHPCTRCSYSKGIHTINSIEDKIFVDGRRDIFFLKKSLVKYKRDYT